MAILLVPFWDGKNRTFAKVLSDFQRINHLVTKYIHDHIDHSCHSQPKHKPTRFIPTFPENSLNLVFLPNKKSENDRDICTFRLRIGDASHHPCVGCNYNRRPEVVFFHLFFGPTSFFPSVFCGEPVPSAVALSSEVKNSIARARCARSKAGETPRLLYWLFGRT